VFPGNYSRNSPSTTGTKVTAFELTTLNAKKSDDGGEDKNQSYFSGASLSGGLNFGFEFNPSTALGIEFSLSSNTAGLSDGNYNLDITNYSGIFAVKVKL
jgi:hypothetical protein